MTPRPRSFDEGAALARAMDLFWSLGYEATSMQNLVDHMGIGRQSLYNTYGDKHHLYVSALKLYDQQAHTDSLSILESPRAALAEVRAFVLGVARRFTTQQDRRACFLMNALLELSPRDAQVAHVGRSFRLKLIGHLQQALERAKALGEVRSDLEPVPAARQLANTVMGLSLTWKAGCDPEELVLVAESALADLLPQAESGLPA